MKINVMYYAGSQNFLPDYVSVNNENYIYLMMFKRKPTFYQKLSELEPNFNLMLSKLEPTLNLMLSKLEPTDPEILLIEAVLMRPSLKSRLSLPTSCQSDQLTLAPPVSFRNSLN